MENNQMTAPAATRQHRAPAPMSAFEPIVMPHAPVPQLAIDHVVRKLATDPAAFAIDYLNLQHTVRVLHERGQQQEWAEMARASLHPTVAEILSKRIEAVCARLDLIEDRIGGRDAKGAKVEKSLEDLRESVTGLLARENV
jgi:hypothetical protein